MYCCDVSRWLMDQKRHEIMTLHCHISVYAVVTLHHRNAAVVRAAEISNIL
jgi:hypothetical protein